MDRLALLIAATGWACWHLCAKAGVRHITPVAAMLIYALSAIPVIPVYWLMLGKEPTTKLNLPGVAFAVLAYLITNVATLAYSYALTQRPVSDCATWTAGYPAMTVLLAIPLFGEQLTWAKGLGLGLVIAGLIVVSSGR